MVRFIYLSVCGKSLPEIVDARINTQVRCTKAMVQHVGLTSKRMHWYDIPMSWKKRGIGEYQNEKRRGAGHDLDFDGSNDLPILHHKDEDLRLKKTREKKGKDPEKPDVGEPGRLKENEQFVHGLIESDTGDAGYRKAAKFLLLLGKEQAAKILKHFTPEEIEGISREIAVIRKIDKEEADELLKEFGLLRQSPVPNRGGMAAAAEILYTTFGKEKGDELLKRAVPHGGGKPFEFLNDLEFHQILQILKHEPTAVMAIILPHLQTSLSAKILESLSPDQQKILIPRIAKLDKIDKDVLIRIEDALKEKIRKQGKVVTEEVDGTSVLADILKHMTISEEDSILGYIDEVDPELSREIKEKLFSVDTVLDLDDQDLQKVLRDFDDRELSLVLKGKSDDFKDKLLSNVSERRKSMIMEEIEFSGAVKRSDVEKATKEFLRYLQNMVDEGKIVLKRGNEYYI